MGCCIRHEDGERTSISVWCSHAQAPACEIKSEHVTDGQQCWHPPGGKKAKNRSLGYFCPLTTGGLISVRCFSGCAATHVEGTGPAPGRAVLCSPGAAGRGDRLVIGALCPYVRLVPGVCDYITGDRHRPDPVWETAGISPLPRPRPRKGVPFSCSPHCGGLYDATQGPFPPS